MPVLYLILGLIVGVGFVRLAVRNVPDGERRLGSALIVAAFIYVAFAMAAMESAWLLVEMAGVAVFGVFVALGAMKSPLWLAAGWFLHIFWDAGLHLMTDAAFAPAWYVVACISFDLVLAAYIVFSAKSPVTAKEPSIA